MGHVRLPVMRGKPTDHCKHVRTPWFAGSSLENSRADHGDYIPWHRIRLCGSGGQAPSREARSAPRVIQTQTACHKARTPGAYRNFGSRSGSSAPQKSISFPAD